MSPVSILMEATNPIVRSQAYSELGRRALARQDVDAARDHWTRAVRLHPQDTETAALLQGLAPAHTPSRFAAVRRWLSPSA